MVCECIRSRVMMPPRCLREKPKCEQESIMGIQAISHHIDGYLGLWANNSQRKEMTPQQVSLTPTQTDILRLA